MSLADAKMLNPKYEIGDTVQIPLDSKKLDVLPHRTQRT